VTAPSGTLTVGTLPAGFTATVSNDVPTARVLLVVSATGGGDPYGTWLDHYGLSGGMRWARRSGCGWHGHTMSSWPVSIRSQRSHFHVISVAKSGSDMTSHIWAPRGQHLLGGPASRTKTCWSSRRATGGNYNSNNFASTAYQHPQWRCWTWRVDNMWIVAGNQQASRYYRVRVLVP